MKSAKLILLLLVSNLALYAVRASESSAPAGDVERKTAKSDRDLEMANLVLAKTFCVAMRRNDQARLRQLIDPEYLKRIKLGDQKQLPIEIAPVLGIHNIVISNDRQTALCLYGTSKGDKEALLLRTRWTNGRLYVLPTAPRNAVTGHFQPWSLRTQLNSFFRKP